MLLNVGQRDSGFAAGSYGWFQRIDELTTGYQLVSCGYFLTLCLISACSRVLKETTAIGTVVAFLYGHHLNGTKLKTKNLLATDPSWTDNTKKSEFNLLIRAWTRV